MAKVAFHNITCNCCWDAYCSGLCCKRGSLGFCDFCFNNISCSDGWNQWFDLVYGVRAELRALQEVQMEVEDAYTYIRKKEV